MRHCLIDALEQKRFDFGYLAGSASRAVTLLPAIEAANHSWVSLNVRVHARDMVAGQSVTLQLFNTLPCETDNREFIEYSPTSVTPNALLTVTISSAVPTVVPSVLFNATTNTGPYLKLVLTANQASSPGIFYLETSVVVLMREAT